MLRIVMQEVDVYQILDLRHRVLREGLPRETAQFGGDEDPTTRHFASFLGDESDNPVGNPICCVSFLPSSLGGEPAWQLRGMATDPRYQGHGIGSGLLAYSETLLVQTGPSLFWCNAREPAIRFYRRHGWECISGIFVIPTAGFHRKMRLRRSLPA